MLSWRPAFGKIKFVGVFVSDKMNYINSTGRIYYRAYNSLYFTIDKPIYVLTSGSTMADHNRPLSKKGRLAAANIATKLEKHSWVPQLILCRFVLSPDFLSCTLLESCLEY